MDEKIFEINAKAYNEFLDENIGNPKFHTKYVSFIGGVFQGSDESKDNLEKSMVAKFGEVEMLLGKVERRK